MSVRREAASIWSRIWDIVCRFLAVPQVTRVVVGTQGRRDGSE
jgi:hypothetical protein